MRVLKLTSTMLALVVASLLCSAGTARKSPAVESSGGSSVAQASTGGRASPREKIVVSKLGPQVGERVPGFSLKDQDGKVRTLDSIMGPNGAMLVFYRSADW